MALTGTYVPSASEWVRRNVEEYEASDGQEGGTLPGTDYPVVVITSVGARSGHLRKNPVMRVEHDGAYLAVASNGGADDDPVWAHNFRAHPLVELQDGADTATYDVRELPDNPERDAWWRRAVEAWPTYGDYQRRTDRLIPLFLLERRS